MADQTDNGVVVVGVRPRPLQDLYHVLLRFSWAQALVAIAAAYLLANVVFAVGYMITGGIDGSRGGFLDAFFFSVETMGTIGYGELHPVTVPSHVLVVVESVAGLILTALATGLVFAKFSLPASRLVFSKQVVIAPMNGVPTMMLRVGNGRRSIVAEATVKLAMVRTEVTHEGETFYRLVDLPLARERSPALGRSWTVMHVIDDKSPLRGATPESLVSEEAELLVTIVGTDDTSLQPLHARHRYLATEIVWGARHADVLSARPDGVLELDVRKFHDIVRSKPTEAFPYPR